MMMFVSAEFVNLVFTLYLDKYKTIIIKQEFNLVDDQICNLNREARTEQKLNKTANPPWHLFVSLSKCLTAYPIGLIESRCLRLK